MRHNLRKVVLILRSSFDRILKTGLYTLAVAVFISSFSPLESKPESSRSSRSKTQETKTADPDQSSKTDKAAAKTAEPIPENPETKEINQSWMNTIHGGTAPQPESVLSKGSSDAKKSSGDESSSSSPSDESDVSGTSGDSVISSPRADEEEQSGRDFFTPPNQTEPPSFFSVLVRFVLMMAALVGGLYYVARFVKKKQGIPVSGENNLLKLIVTIPLMPGKYLQVVELAGQLMVLGVSDSGVNLVKHIDDGPTADRIRMWKDSQSSDSFGPATLPEKIASLLSVKEFQFWKHESGSNPKNRVTPANTSFEDLLSGDSGEGKRAHPDHSGYSEHSGRSSEKSGDLSQLLSRQKTRLAALKKKNNLPDDEDYQ